MDSNTLEKAVQLNYLLGKANDAASSIGRGLAQIEEDIDAVNNGLPCIGFDAAPLGRLIANSCSTQEQKSIMLFVGEIIAKKQQWIEKEIAEL